MDINTKEQGMSDETKPDLIGATLREAIDHAQDREAREQAREAYGQHLQSRGAQEAPKAVARPGIPLLHIDPRQEAQERAEGEAMIEAYRSSNGVTRPQPFGGVA